MKQPLVSIIIPTFKRPEPLDISISSCLNQTYEDIEIIVVDDNNPNTVERKNTEVYMKKYKGNKKIIYLKQEKNGGGSVARNAGIGKASGEYVTFLDDDDEYLPEKIQKQVEYLLEYNYDMIFSNIIINYDDLNIRQEQRYKKNFELNQKSLMTKHLVDVISGTPTFMFKKEVLQEIGGFYDIQANQEYILMLKTIAGNYKIGYFNYAGVIAHVHSNEVRISNSKKVIDAKIKVVELIKPYLNMIDYKDRRYTLCRLYSFIFFQSFKRNDKRVIKYFFNLLPYIDLVIKRKLSKEDLMDKTILYK